MQAKFGSRGIFLPLAYSVFLQSVKWSNRVTITTLNNVLYTQSYSFDHWITWSQVPLLFLSKLGAAVSE